MLPVSRDTLLRVVRRRAMQVADRWHLMENASAAMAIDIYVWLAYRLHSLSAPVPISWSAVALLVAVRRSHGLRGLPVTAATVTGDNGDPGEQRAMPLRWRLHGLAAGR